MEADDPTSGGPVDLPAPTSLLRECVQVPARARALFPPTAHRSRQAGVRGQHPPQVLQLLCALALDSPSTSDHLARALTLSQPSISLTIRAAADHGLVEAANSTSGARGRSHRLTEAGADIVEALLAEVRQLA